MIMLESPEVQAAVISAWGAILASLIAAIAAALIGRQVLGRKRLQEKLTLARHDIQFLLEVERQHCSKHRERENQSHKIRVRRTARENGYNWSGKFTEMPPPNQN